MRRSVGAVVLAAAAVIAVPGAASAAKFQYGVTAAEVTRTGATLWTRAPKTGKVVLDVGVRKRFGRGTTHLRLTARKLNDKTLVVKVGRLHAGHVYFYRFRQGKAKSAVGRFKTAPAAARARTLKFAVSGDADAQPAQSESKPYYNNFEAYRSMANEKNDFNINLGDTIYSDSEVDASIVGGEFVPLFSALTVEQKWAKYKQNLALGNLRLIRRSTGMFNHWDDHEFVNDFTVAEKGRPLYNRGVTAFTEYMPTTFRPSTGIYRQVRWGKNAELFFLDERSFRSAKASANGVCDNPQTGHPDFAPTAPQRVRTVFAAIEPSFNAPVSPQCLATIRDPNRTMLGKSQLARFQKAIRASKARWKIVINEVPIQQYYEEPYDRWEGYEAERQTVLKTLSQVKNVAVLTTDTHANFFNDARFQTLEEGGAKDSGVPEMVTGPVATMTYDREIDRALQRPGTGETIRAAFFKPPPPNGIGMRCAVTDVFSYTEVQVSSKQLVLRPKDLDGKPVSEPGGAPCGPFTLKAK